MVTAFGDSIQQRRNARKMLVSYMVSKQRNLRFFPPVGRAIRQNRWFAEDLTAVCGGSPILSPLRLKIQKVYFSPVREQILDNIRKLAVANGGQPPGFRRFQNETGIRESEWRGVYWARWSDAVSDAGLQPNPPNPKHDTDYLLRKFADACKHFGKIPTAAELRLHGRANPDFPNHKMIYRRFQSTANMLRELAQWTESRAEYAGVSEMLAQQVSETKLESNRSAEGFVYLIRWGVHYKIGRGEQLEQRVKQVRTGLPDSGTLVHAIRTDDPPGIEAYWHRRFAEKRAKNGEWFKLSTSDVAAFKRRKFQ